MDIETAIGPVIRKRRKEKGLTLPELGARAGFSISHLSQIERGLTSPSLSALHLIGDALDVRVSELIHACEPVSLSADKLISRLADRKVVHVAGSEVSSQFISRDGSNIQMVWDVAPPGSKMDIHQKTSPGEECGFIIKGQMRLFIEDDVTILEAGDACFIDALTSHWWENSGDEDLHVIWAFLSQ